MKRRAPTGDDFDSFKKRLEWLKESTGVEISAEEKKWSEDLRGLIENPIGFVKMPLSLAGPFLIHGDYVNGNVLLPLCTLEGTLTMSMMRGAYVTHLAGGIHTHYLKQEISRSPIFTLPDIKSAAEFIKKIFLHFNLIKEATESTTRYGKLIRIDPYQFGSRVILDFIYTTGDAAGQNMVTIATHAGCLWIQKQFEERFPLLPFLIESNFSGDKNSCARNLIKGRGHSATATVNISEKLVRRVLKTTPEKLAEGSLNGTVGSHLAGMIGFNLHTTNALTAIYLATGQDAACVVENSSSIIEGTILNDGSFNATITLPSLTIGTIGGGTRLQDQNKNLAILGCIGENSTKRFAEIIAASCLCLEISLASAIVGDEFVASHQKYGRPSPQKT